MAHFSRKRDLSNLKPEEIRLNSARQVIEYLGIPFWNIPKCLGIARKEMSKKLSSINIFNGIKELLKNLKQQYSLGIVTSNGEQNTKQILKNNSIDYFGIIHSGTSLFGKDKVIKSLLKQYNISKNNVIYVGDEVRDIEATKKIEIPIISVSWGYNSKKVLSSHNPDYIADTPTDVAKYLLK